MQAHTVNSTITFCASLIYVVVVACKRSFGSLELCLVRNFKTLNLAESCASLCVIRELTGYKSTRATQAPLFNEYHATWNIFFLEVT